MDIIRKTMLIILVILMVMMFPSCRMKPQGEGPAPGQQKPAPEIAEEDKLAKSKKEGVEENINGFSIEDDFKMTEEDGKRIFGLSQQQRSQMLEQIGSKKMNTVLEEYNTTLPEGINYSIQYFKYNISYDYLLITAEDNARVREKPSTNSAEVDLVEYLDKVSLLQRVEGDEFHGSNIWYRIAFENGGKIVEGYVHSSKGTPRVFRFENMKKAIIQLQEEVNQGELHFISNYKNENGPPPQKGDFAVDEHGYRVYHSAPAYEQPNMDSDFRYIPDGMLVRILGENNGFYHVNSLTFGRDYYVPKQYIDPNATLSSLKHVVVVDRDQQNQAAFQLTEKGLNLISYTLSTTGFPGEFSFETTLGSYKAIAKRERFEYLKSGTQDIAGYAPFAIRFTGGAYIHGVPVAYEEKDGEKIDPGFIEYLHTIGTFPRSNMCVRNFTSHAEFLYNWMDIQNGAVIVIE